MLRSTDLPERGGAASGTRRWLDLVLPAAFYLLFVVQLAHHQLWRDEVNAFGLASSSSNLRVLFSRFHYEGHPFLWYVLLWVVSSLSNSATSIKVLEACIVAVTYGLLGLRSPFSRFERLLLLSSYFLSFEYAVLSRMYSLLAMLLLFYLSERTRHPGRFMQNCAVLGLMASTDTIGLILSACLLTEYLIWQFYSSHKDATPSRRATVPGLSVYAAMTTFAVWSALPAKDISWPGTEHPLAHLWDGGHLLLSAIDFTGMPFLPVALGRYAPSFWNPVAGQHPLLYLASLPLMLSALVFIFRSHRRLSVVVGLVVASSAAFGHLIFLGAMRHWGIVFLGFLSALWLLRHEGKPLPKVALLLLGLSAASGVYTAYAQWRRPFSNAESAAAWLRANHLDTMPIAGTPDTSVAPLAVLLHRPVYLLECNCEDRYVLFSTRRDGFRREQIAARLALARRKYAAGRLIYIDAYPLREETRLALLQDGLRLHERARFTGATVAEEDFYIYEVEP